MSYDEWKVEQPVIRRLLDEIDRLAEKYDGDSKALRLLQDIQNWAIEETVPPVDAHPNWIDGIKAISNG